MSLLDQLGFGGKSPTMAGPTPEGPTLDMAAAPIAAANPWMAAAAVLGPSIANAMKASPSNATALQNSDFNSSGWNVNFGSGGITSSATQSKTDPGVFSGQNQNWIGTASALLGLALMVKALRSK